VAIWHQSASRAEHSLTHLLPPLFAAMGDTLREAGGSRGGSFGGSAKVSAVEGRPPRDQEQPRPRPGETGRDRSASPANQSFASKPATPAQTPAGRPDARPSPAPKVATASATTAATMPRPLAGAQGRDRQRNDRSHDASALAGAQGRDRQRNDRSDDASALAGAQGRDQPRKRTYTLVGFPFGNPTSATRGTATAFGEAESSVVAPTHVSMREGNSAADGGFDETAACVWLSSDPA
jgi:type IV secretory pathway VirB10-like protein